MKTARFLKLSVGLLIIALIGLCSYNLTAQSKQQNKISEDIIDDINITIDKSASSANLEDIKKTLETYNITVEFSNIQRNDLDEITGITVKLSNSSGQQAMSQMSSNMPISKISFGSKNGQLYVNHGEQQLNMFGLFSNNQNQMPLGFDNDSLFNQHFNSFQSFNLDDLFNDKSSVFMFNGDSLTIDQLKDKMMQNFSFKNPSGDRFSFIFDDNYNNTAGTYKFIDDPNKDKIIIIDGEVSNFKTLDRLAKNNNIDQVDYLKPETAMSVYGDKGKDGAIIVTTKN